MRTKDLLKALRRSAAAAILAALAAGTVLADSGEDPAVGAGSRPVVRIGLFDTFSPQFYALTVEPTLSFLSSWLPDYLFEFQYIPAADAANALKAGKIDFFIAGAGAYGDLERQVGIRHIATRRVSGSGDPSRSAAAAFIVRAESPILKLEDMQGKTVVASQPMDFEGWQIGMGEVAAQGYSWRTFFKSISFVHYQTPDVLADVLAGNADVGVVRACLLEEMERDGWIQKDVLRVVNEKKDASSPFPCRRSTALYPDAVFAAMESAPADVVRDVTITILSMPASDRGWDWSVSSDFLSVDRLYRSLEIGPYEYLNDSSWKGLWRRHKEKIIPIAALLLLLFAYEARLHYLVKVRTRDLTRALKEKETAETDAKQSRRRLSSLERAGVISQMSSMIAHELKQPLASISNYAGGLREYWGLKGAEPDKMEARAISSISEEAARASAIVDRVRAYAKNQVGPMERVNLSETVKKAIRTYERNAEDPVAVGAEIQDGLFVTGHGLELELLVLNLVRNAAQAVANETRPSVTVILSRLMSRAEIRVLDNGPKISDEDFRRLTEISESVKPEGLGLGLAIVRDIADRHGASVRFERRLPKGMRGIVTIELAKEDAE